MLAGSIKIFFMKLLLFLLEMNSQLKTCLLYSFVTAPTPGIDARVAVILELAVAEVYSRFKAHSYRK
jgi:hypothetical protein